MASRGTVLIAVVVLALLVVFGVWQWQGIQGPTTPPPAPGTPPTPPPSNSNAEQAQKVTHPPGREGTEADYKNYLLYVTQVARAGALDVTGCQPNPVALKVAAGSEVAITNRDRGEHRLLFDKKNVFIIPGNETIRVKPTFTQPSGVFSYACDKPPTIAGVWVIE